MTFLTGLAAQLIYMILGAVVSLVAAYVYTLMRRAQLEKQAKESVQPLKDAKTPKEIDDAADSTLDHF
jgi:uncharacterized membrane protein YraQ (UPF0718 family)